MNIRARCFLVFLVILWSGCFAPVPEEEPTEDPPSHSFPPLALLSVSRPQNGEAGNLITVNTWKDGDTYYLAVDEPATGVVHIANWRDRHITHAEVSTGTVLNLAAVSEQGTTYLAYRDSETSLWAGVVKPDGGFEPRRLEMGTTLSTETRRSLTSWDLRLAAHGGEVVLGAPSVPAGPSFGDYRLYRLSDMLDGQEVASEVFGGMGGFDSYGDVIFDDEGRLWTTYRQGEDVRVRHGFWGEWSKAQTVLTESDPFAAPMFRLAISPDARHIALYPIPYIPPSYTAGIPTADQQYRLSVLDLDSGGIEHTERFFAAPPEVAWFNGTLWVVGGEYPGGIWTWTPDGGIVSQYEGPCDVYLVRGAGEPRFVLRRSADGTRDYFFLKNLDTVPGGCEGSRQ